MSNTKIERSKIEKMIEDYMFKNQVVSIEELTDKIWGYIEETVRKVDYPVTVRIKEGTRKKGGLNEMPTTPRPAPPKPQGIKRG